MLYRGLILYLSLSARLCVYNTNTHRYSPPNAGILTSVKFSRNAMYFANTHFTLKCLWNMDETLWKGAMGEKRPRRKKGGVARTAGFTERQNMQRKKMIQRCHQQEVSKMTANSISWDLARYKQRAVDCQVSRRDAAKMCREWRMGVLSADIIHARSVKIKQKKKNIYRVYLRILKKIQWQTIKM